MKAVTRPPAAPMTAPTTQSRPAVCTNVGGSAARVMAGVWKAECSIMTVETFWWSGIMASRFSIATLTSASHWLVPLG